MGTIRRVLATGESDFRGISLSRQADSEQSRKKGRPILWIVVAIGFAVVFGTAEPAAAWGPITHITLGHELLGGLGLVPAAIAAILSRHRIAYLYGCIAADIVFAKRLSRIKQFCHHWSTGFQLLDSAEDERSKAFAYGYLSHLAADTVAHGKYVPHQISMTGASVNFGHFYWELRAETIHGPEQRRLTEQVVREDHRSHHVILSRHITDTFLWYGANRLVFERMNALAIHRGFAHSMHLWSRYSRWPLSMEYLSGYRGESIDRMVSVLAEGTRSPVLRDDPNGTSALMQVHVRQREMRRLKRAGSLSHVRMREAVRGLAPLRSTPPIAVGSDRSQLIATALAL